jgi:UDP-N-acetylglucosamine--N-acetylmuramyl-(pentapeptide) pyrophosphoryl-undecaprenol N-acetylglucosamine transferase
LAVASSLHSPRVLIAGGGTGGHIFPALAVARELKERYEAEVLFVGTARGLESRLVPQAGFPLELIPVGPLNQVSLATKFKTAATLPMSLLTCSQIMSSFKPDAVFGVGGYASGPAMGTAILRRIPTMAFEPNAVPGMANRLIGKRVTAAAVNFPPAAKWFRNAEVTGIPVRPEFFSVTAPPANAAPHLLIFGGSQGAGIFNRIMPPLVPQLLEAVPGLTILHQAGARHADATREAYVASGADAARWRVEAFLDNMAERFSAAHLILARSGASTVAELAAAGKPSLLIPFARAADDHQKSNALVMVEAGAAEMLEESQLGDPQIVVKTVAALFADGVRLKAMGEAARTQAHSDAAARIAARLLTLAKR